MVLGGLVVGALQPFRLAFGVVSALIQFEQHSAARS